ncbi:MAG: MBL fold metallo-hydrolase [Ruminococcaceae bacterium]|jgi:glyoxylase-like metal-dependent hydrolase (beta-lactamase superfamily II)|nr:MBL fold metallo-hydrolase [Oscillospiraceae bacterium]
MKITHFVLGELATNCYFLLDEETKEAAVIDPADEAETLRRAVEDAGATLRYILLTHGHRDHTLAAPELHKLFPDAAVYIHPADKGQVGIYRYPMEELIGPALRFYEDGDTLALGSLTIEVLHTPGHTGGSVCLKCGNVLFTGDTLFASSMGRIDLPGAVPEKMMDSLARLAKLEGDFEVLPGHMETTTLAHERKYNMYLRML